MKDRIICSALLAIATVSFSMACSSGSARTPDVKQPVAAATNAEASEVVKEIYELAIGRRCSEIPSKLSEDFRSAAGSSKDELDALCDSFTDSGKISSIAITTESITGDKGTIRVALTHRDGRVEEKDERVKRESGTWLMDS
ncbi:MAG: hypothetical protein ABL984_04190 [Pyrinomonadaceae bacterium]